MPGLQPYAFVLAMPGLKMSGTYFEEVLGLGGYKPVDLDEFAPRLYRPAYPWHAAVILRRE